MAQEAITYVVDRQAAKWEIRGGTATTTETSAYARGAEGPYLSVVEQRSMRDQFLSIEQSEEARLLEFLNATGVWEKGRSSVPLSEFWEHQQTMRYLLTKRKPKEFTATRTSAESKLSLVLLQSLYIGSIYRAPWLRLPATIELGTVETRGALYLSVWRDLVRRADFRYCAREDCPDHGPFKTPFEVTRQDRLYCSQYCAHLVSLRKKRASRRNQRR